LASNRSPTCSPKFDAAVQPSMTSCAPLDAYGCPLTTLTPKAARSPGLIPISMKTGLSALMCSVSTRTPTALATPGVWLIRASSWRSMVLVMMLDALFWATVIYAIVTVVLVATQTPGGVDALGFVLRLPGLWMTAAAWVTLIFAIIEYAAARCPGKFPMLAPPSTNWSPADLPPLQPEFAGGKKPRSFAGAVTEVIFGFLFLMWWLLIPKYPYLLIGPGVFYIDDWGHVAAPFHWAPVWHAVYWWVLALHVVRLGWQCLDLKFGRWQRPRTVQQIAMSALGLIPLGILLAAPGQMYFTLRHPEEDAARFGAALQSINLAIHWCAVVICVISVVTVVVGLGRMGLEAYRKRVAGMPPA